MADVKKINGYNIKDASARSDIASLQATVDTPSTGLADRVGALETTIDTPSTGLTDRVGALELAINTPDTGIDAKITELQNNVIELNRENGYSTGETKIGGTISDPVYRYHWHINAGTLPDNSGEAVSPVTRLYGISGSVKKVYSIYGTIWDTDSNSAEYHVAYPVNFIIDQASSHNICTYYNAVSDELCMILGLMDWSDFEGDIFMEYEKNS